MTQRTRTTDALGGSDTVLITGLGLALPGVDFPAGIAERGENTPVDPAARIGKKGLRYKDRATQLGLVAAHDALRDAGLMEGEGRGATVDVPPQSVGVVASSNYGNLDTVCDVVQTIAEDGSSRLLSPVMTPNLSSNVIASEVALRFALRGPNLTVCNGPTSGLDAVRWAVTWLAAGRARYALVLGSEPDNPVVRGLAGSGPVVDGAVALVLEHTSSATERGAAPLAELGPYARAADVPGVVTALGVEGKTLVSWYGPEGASADDVLAGTERIDLSPDWGVTSGVLGVLQCAAAIGQFAAGRTGSVLAVAGGPGDDASAGVLLRSPTRVPR
ncbi:beta-ketoacyl synthase N-terminal-like domain-containing protein [Streptomyces gobiensis]|uniref:beta-ketoacyl synthase N-terminal-like domain-containing protein n=1 Tax=Streptomyces gobiensis TaxID=2875706 RepID=UPI001E408580|nr:beta-ketoacyl synthase N-terminal-like domain-containing protein [Streptomyces gobiensis]UGY94194.1 hypothetical protein test1122_22350 [Streptomyces gobiensis]